MRPVDFGNYTTNRPLRSAEFRNHASVPGLYDIVSGHVDGSWKTSSETQMILAYLFHILPIHHGSFHKRKRGDFSKSPPFGAADVLNAREFSRSGYGSALVQGAGDATTDAGPT